MSRSKYKASLHPNGMVFLNGWYINRPYVCKYIKSAVKFYNSTPSARMRVSNTGSIYVYYKEGDNQKVARFSDHAPKFSRCHIHKFVTICERS